jgi:XTP/dITP diphosphohydrolase
MKILIASRNRGKIRELDRLLSAYITGTKIELLSLDDVGFEGEIEENGTSFQENALIKARAGAEFSGLVTVADDSGLAVDALGGAPGIYSARYAGEGHDDEANNRLLLENLRGVADRSAAYVCAMACVFPDSSPLAGDPLVTVGTVKGEILCEPRGEGGFGYDPLFWFDPYGKTFAEIDQDEKNAVSHRGEAVKQLGILLSRRIDEAKEKLWRKYEI